MVSDMAELSPIAEVGEALPSQQIAARIRAHMAVQQITGQDAAGMIGMAQRSFSRRYRGQIEWSVNELSQLAQAFGLTFEQLTQHEPIALQIPNSPTPDGGRHGGEYAIRDSNPEPADYASATLSRTAAVLPFRPRPRSRAQTISNGWGATVVRLDARASRRTATHSWRSEVSS